MSRRPARVSASVPPEDRTLPARLDALWPDVVRPMRGLYGDRSDFDALLDRLRDQVSAAYAERSPDLRALDERRLVAPDWFQRTEMLGYVCYVDRFAGTLRDLLGDPTDSRPTPVDYLR